MNYVMGNFGAIEDSSFSSDNLVSTGINIATSSLDRSFDTLSKVAKTKQVEQFIADNNLAPYMKDITKDNIKTVLALFGLFSVYRFVRSPIGIALVAGTAIYVMSTTDVTKLIPKMMDKQDADKPEAPMIPALASVESKDETITL